jgi:hypothetical protein
MKRFLAPALLSMALAAPVAAQDISYEVINASSLTLMEFYTSASSDPSWGPDILGADVLAAGATGYVNIVDGGAECAYDIRMVFDNGATLEDNVDICAMGSYTITD